MLSLRIYDLQEPWTELSPSSGTKLHHPSHFFPVLGMEPRPMHTSPASTPKPLAPGFPPGVGIVRSHTLDLVWSLHSDCPSGHRAVQKRTAPSLTLVTELCEEGCTLHGSWTKHWGLPWAWRPWPSAPMMPHCTFTRATAEVGNHSGCNKIGVTWTSCGFAQIILFLV